MTQQPPTPWKSLGDAAAKALADARAARLAKESKEASE